MPAVSTGPIFPAAALESPRKRTLSLSEEPPVCAAWAAQQQKWAASQVWRPEDQVSQGWFLLSCEAPSPGLSPLLVLCWHPRPPLVCASITCPLSPRPRGVPLCMSVSVQMRRTPVLLGQEPTLLPYDLIVTNYICKGPVAKLRSHSED